MKSDKIPLNIFTFRYWIPHNQETKQKYGRKPPASTHEKLQMDKFALEEKVRTMEAKVKEAVKRAEEAERQAGMAKQGG